MTLATRLIHDITIQERVEVQNATTGEVTVTWQTVALDSDTELENVRAEVLTGAGKEAYKDGTKYANVDARITIRWIDGIDESMRIVWDGKVFNILGIEYDKTARKEIRFKCQSGMSDGR